MSKTLNSSHLKPHLRQSGKRIGKQVMSSSNGGSKSIASRLTAVSAASAISLAVPVSLLLLSTLGTQAAQAAPDYFECATELKAAGVADESAIAACAGARYPEDLGACVIDINELTGLTGDAALLVCGRSRRPIEVADCTIDIHAAFFESPSTEVLENCGRSLLPARYSTCVVDIVDATEVAVDTALTQCMRAGFRPWTLEPRS